MFLGLIDGVFLNLALQLAVRMPRQLGFRERGKKKTDTQNPQTFHTSVTTRKQNCPHRPQIESHFLKASKLHRERSKHQRLQLGSNTSSQNPLMSAHYNKLFDSSVKVFLPSSEHLLRQNTQKEKECAELQ